VYLSLQAGRGIAALLVVIFHLGSIVGAEKYFDIPALLIPYALGGTGVHFFFILSGFVIYSAHCDDFFQPRKFLPYVAKRLIRIYPIYWIIFLSVYWAAVLVPGFEHRATYDWHVILMSLLLFPQNQAVVGGTGAPVIEVAWTLQMEMVFYFLFGLFILGRAVASLTVLILVLIYINREHLGNDFLIRFIFQKHVLYLFLLGVGASWLCSKKILGIVSASILLAGGLVLFFFVAADWIARLGIYSSGDKLYAEGAALGAIVIGLITLEQNKVVIGGQKILQLIGAASYSLYLSHYHVILLLTKLAVAIGVSSWGAMGVVVTLIITAGACLGTSAILYMFFEKPLTAMLRRKVLHKI